MNCIDIWKIMIFLSKVFLKNDLFLNIPKSYQIFVVQFVDSNFKKITQSGHSECILLLLPITVRARC